MIIVPIGIWLTGLAGTWWLSTIWTIGILALLHIGIKKSILTGAFSFGIVWLLAGIYSLSIDDTDMIGRTSSLLGGISSKALLLITLIIGLVTGALSGWLGGVLGQFLKNKNIAQQNG